jgi:hypothetical protein
MIGRKKNGSELIADVIGKFESMVNDLGKGVSDCETQRTSIAEQITALKKRDEILDTDIQRARTVRYRSR